jgi:hypothetical protein
MFNIMKKPFNHLFLNALAVGSLVVLAQSAESQSVLYNNTTTSQSANFDPAGGTTFGNEVVLSTGAPFDSISSFAFQFDLTGTATFTGSEDVNVTFYANNGAPATGGAASPSTVLWNSGTASLASYGLGAYTTGAQLTLTVPNITVGPDFTWAVTFSNLQGGDQAGLALYGPSTVGFNYGDAWVNSGSGWSLQVASGSNPPLKFGVEILGTPTGVPEPGTIAFGVMGLCAFVAHRRNGSK